MSFKKVSHLFFVMTIVLSLGLGGAWGVDLVNGTISCTSATETQFVPSWGKVIVAEDSFSRYIWQYMYWHDTARLKWLKDNVRSIYEPDAFFYNYYDVDGTPVNGGPAYGKAPFNYWASNLPVGYVDTQLDSKMNMINGRNSGQLIPFGYQENQVTIGTAWAHTISAGVVYFTTTRMTSGAGSSSWIKLSSERGRMWPNDACVKTSCAFGCESVSNISTIPMTKHFSAPGCYQFWYHWNSDAWAPC